MLGDLNQDLVDSPPHCYGSRANQRRLLDALDGAGLVAATAGDGDPVRRGAGAAWRWPEGARSELRGVSDHFGAAVVVEGLDGMP
ncbi:MAG: hypothetical protein IT332_13155 [Ardenticatenales bacterium]|nr:hypothetical protein [Ardenticatenales bacterium]